MRFQPQSSYERRLFYAGFYCILIRITHGTEMHCKHFHQHHMALPTTSTSSPISRSSRVVLIEYTSVEILVSHAITVQPNHQRPAMTQAFARLYT